mmetsp:Transcript_19349/g.39727  ORF Transcript_19349/g.39727 Transcript_19349/m.39727 type:complete len:521 (-) Transcript_19349:875-2437(-)
MWSTTYYGIADTMCEFCDLIPHEEGTESSIKRETFGFFSAAAIEEVVRQANNNNNNNKSGNDTQTAAGRSSKNGSGESENHRKRAFLRYGCAFAIALVIAAAVLAWRMLGRGDEESVFPPSTTDDGLVYDDDDYDYETNQMMESDMGQYFQKAVTEVLPDGSVRSALADYSSPQHKAFAFLVQNEKDLFRIYDMEPLSVVEQSKLITIFSLVTLYHSLNGPRWYVGTNWLRSDVSICEWHGVNCKGEDLAKETAQEGAAATDESKQTTEDNGGGRRRTASNTHNSRGSSNSNNNNNNNNDTTPILLEEKADCSSFYNDCFDPYYTKIDAWGGDPEGREYYEYFQDTLPVHSLYLRANGLSGTIPDELGLLTNVYKEIHMGSNEMFGPVPSHIGMLSMLQRLSFESNELASTLPTELGQMTHIRSFDISSNYAIKGAFPTEFGRLTNIEKFQVQNTNLSGGVPPEFCEMIETRSAELSQDNVELVFRASCEKYFRCTCCTECCVQQLNAVDKCVVPHLAVP